MSYDFAHHYRMLFQTIVGEECPDEIEQHDNRITVTIPSQVFHEESITIVSTTEYVTITHNGRTWATLPADTSAYATAMVVMGIATKLAE